MNKLCTLSSNSNVCELSSPTIETCSEITPLIEVNINLKNFQLFILLKLDTKFSTTKI